MRVNSLSGYLIMLSALLASAGVKLFSGSRGFGIGLTRLMGLSPKKSRSWIAWEKTVPITFRMCLTVTTE
jgi:hypothetical protein